MAAPRDSTQLTPQELLELARKMERAPRTLLKAGLKKVVEDPAKVPAAIAEASGKTVSALASPGLYLLQQMGLRMGSGVAGFVDPVLSYYEKAPADALFQDPTVLKESLKGAWKGVSKMEAPHGPPETAEVDVLKKHGYTRGFYRDLPGGEMRAKALMLLSAAQPGVYKAAGDVSEWVTGPEAAAIGMSIKGGDAVTGAAQKVGKGLKAMGAQEKLSELSDKMGVRNAPVIRNILNTFSPMGRVQYKIKNPITGEIMATDVRETMRQYLRERHGEEGATIARLTRVVDGGEKAIKDGAKKYNMNEEERAKYLEIVRENASRGGVFHYDNVLEDGLITRDEREWLGRVDWLLENAIPAARTSRGLKAHRLYEGSVRGAEKAIAAISKVSRLRDEAMALRLGRSTRHILDHEGTPREATGIGNLAKPGEYDRIRRDLAKAISDADWAVKGFSRVSRHKIKTPEFDRSKLFHYTLEELVGLTDNLTAQEARALGFIGFDKDLIPGHGKEWKAVVRLDPGGIRREMRVFDKFGNQVDRIAGDDKLQMEVARRKYGPQLEFSDQSVDEMGERVNRRWTTDKPVRGPKSSPIPRFEAIGKEIRDYDKIFLNYLPRFESDELIQRTAKLRTGRKTGISTALGGARVSAPTTSQEQARELIRNRWVQETKAANQPGAQILEPLQGLTQALKTHIQRNAGATSKAGFLDKVRKSFGVEVQPGDSVTEAILRQNNWIPLGSLKGAVSGMPKELADRYRRSFVPESVFNGIKSLDAALEPQVRTGMEKFFHDVLQVEKSYLTVVNPRFSVRNREWEVMASWLRGNRNMNNWIDANRLVNGYYKNRRVPGFDMTGDELYRYLEREGVLSPEVGISAEMGLGARPLVSSTRGVLRGGKTAGQRAAEPYEAAARDPWEIPDLEGTGGARPKIDKQQLFRALQADAIQAVRAPVRYMGSINQGGEATSRVAHWLWAMRDKKMDRVLARREVGTTMFDYGKDFFTVQEAGLREWIPFYSWHRRIVPFAFRNLFERPGEYAAAGAILSQINAMNGVTPEEMEFLGKTYMNQLGLVLPSAPNQLPGTKPVASLPYAPSDPGQFMNLTPELSETAPGGVFTGALRAGASALRPTAQLGLSFIFAQSPLGEKYTGEITKLPSIVGYLPKDVQDRMGIQKGADGYPYGPSTLIPLIRYLQGGVGEAVGGLQVDHPRAKARTIAWLSGISIDPEVPIEKNRELKWYLDYRRNMDQFERTRGGMYKMLDVMLRESGRPDATEVNP